VLSRRCKSSLLTPLRFHFNFIPDRTTRSIIAKQSMVLCEAMAEYKKQQQRVKCGIFKANAITHSDDFSSISDPSKLLESIINFLYRDMDVVDAMIRQMESSCAQQKNEAGPAELQRSIDWLRHHFTERASGKKLLSFSD
jgi:hypothetical protein